MAKKQFDLTSMDGRLAYAIETYGAKEIAEAIGISISQAYRIGKGSKTTLENAVKIAQVTGFNLQWLAFGEGAERVAGSELKAFSEDGQELLVELKQYKQDQPFTHYFTREYLEELKLNKANCLGWEVDIDNNYFPKGTELVIATDQKTGKGRFVIQVAGSDLIAEVEPKLDGSIDVHAGNTENLTAEGFAALEVVGKIVWHAQKS